MKRAQSSDDNITRGYLHISVDLFPSCETHIYWFHRCVPLTKYDMAHWELYIAIRPVQPAELSPDVLGHRVIAIVSA